MFGIFCKKLCCGAGAGGVKIAIFSEFMREKSCINFYFVLRLFLCKSTGVKVSTLGNFFPLNADAFSLRILIEDSSQNADPDPRESSPPDPNHWLDVCLNCILLLKVETEWDDVKTRNINIDRKLKMFVL